MRGFLPQTLDELQSFRIFAAQALGDEGLEEKDVPALQLQNNRIHFDPLHVGSDKNFLQPGEDTRLYLQRHHLLEHELYLL